jgi:hypothetical protein
MYEEKELIRLPNQLFFVLAAPLRNDMLFLFKSPPSLMVVV